MDAFAKLCRQDSDGKGNLVIDVSSDGSVLAFNDATAQLWKADGRLLQMPSASLLDAQCYELRLQRDIKEVGLDKLVCHGLKAHPRAAFVLLHGILPEKTGPTHVVFLVDTNAAGAKGVPKPQTASSKAPSEHAVIVQRLDCLARYVDHARIAANGLEVLQVSWHQHSAAHFAVLTADNAFSIFSIRQLSTPEQLFKISPLSPTATFSLVDLALEDSSSGAREMVAFTFGSTCGWDPLMVYCMTRSGEVYSLGPIAPFGCLLRTSAVLALKRDSQDDPATLEWLQAATGRTEVGLPLPQLLEKDMWRVSSTVVVQPHSLPGRVLALKGPIVAGAQRGRVFSSMTLVSEKLPRAQAAAAGVEGVTAVVLAGVPGAHAYVSVGLLPAVPLPEWGRGEPLAESDGSGHGTITHVIQRVTSVIPDCDVPPEPLDNLQLQLPARCTVSSSTSTEQLTVTKNSPNGNVTNGDTPVDTLPRTERVWMHAPRQDASAAARGHLEPLLMMCLGGTFWKLYVHALPALAQQIADVASGHSDTPLVGTPTVGRAGASVASSTVGAGTAVFGNGVDSSAAASPSARSATATGTLPPKRQRLPRSRLQELAVPTAGSSAVSSNGTVDGAGLCCVRMFWNALVGDVGIAQHADGSMATFPADDLVLGGLGDNTSFWGTPMATGAPEEGITNAGTSSQVTASGSRAVQQNATKKRTAGGTDVASSLSGPVYDRLHSSKAEKSFSSAMSAGRKVVGSLAEESLVESEQAMRAAYHVQRPELPQASGDVSAGSNPSDVKQALDSDAAALMATGAAYCEHAHAVLLSRFRKVAEELDKNTHAAEVAEVQHRLERIVEVNHVIRERVNKASEAKSGLTARTDALCNATLLNSSFQRCGLNSAEEAARTDLTRIEDSLDTLKRRTTNATTCVRPLMQPTDPVATPSSSENATGPAKVRGPQGTTPGAPGTVGRFGGGAGSQSPSSGWFQGSVAHQRRLGAVGPLRVAKNGKTYTGMGSGWKSAELFGGVSVTNSSSSSADRVSDGRMSEAQKGGRSQHVGLDSRGAGKGAIVGVVAGVEMNSQQMEKLKVQVRGVEQQLDQIRQLQSEVVALCDETTRQDC